MVWLVILGAFTIQPVLLYVFVGMNAAPSPDGQSVIFEALAVAALAAAVFMGVQKLRPKAELGEQPVVPPVAKWQPQSLIAMAFAELASLLAIFIVGGDRMLVYVAATIVVILATILPAGLAYFAALEAQQSESQ
jgi:hypothetical protein